MRHPNVPVSHPRLPELLPDQWEKGGKRGWRLVRVLYQFEMLKGGKDYYSPMLEYDGKTGICRLWKPYSWDRCSVPWLLRWLFRRTEKTLEPGLAHDAGYELGRAGVFDDVPDARNQLDWAFYWNLLDQGNTERKARLMRKGVRVGGASSFRG